MAKTTKPAPKKATGKAIAVAPKQSKAIAVMNEDAFEAYAGAGMEQVDTSDIIIPRVGVLQALSPQLQKSKPEYIKGAKAGQFVNTALGTASDECKLIPVYYTKTWIEWRPRSEGGGIVRVFDNEDEAYDGIEQDDDGKWMRDDNEVKETRTFYCIDVTDPSNPQKVFLPLASSSLRDGRRWITMLKSEFLTGKNGRFNAPIFYRSWNVTPLEKSNDQGEWFGYSFTADAPSLDIDPTGALVQMCIDFKDSIQSGAAKADHSAMGDTSEDDAVFEEV